MDVKFAFLNGGILIKSLQNNLRIMRLKDIKTRFYIQKEPSMYQSKH